VAWLGRRRAAQAGDPDLARGQWQLGRWTWRDTIVLSWFGADPDFSVHRYWDSDGEPLRWYVNFERPFQRTRIGIDTFDLLVDLVIRPDRSGWEWKDQFPSCPRAPWPCQRDQTPADRGENGPGTARGR
jgi:hypothetical protein